MSPSRLSVESWPVTDPGQADENQDTVLIYEPTDPSVARFSGSLYVVADGTGAPSQGKIASRYAAQRIMDAYYNSAEPDLGLRLREAVEAANADLFAYAQAQPELVKTGATVVAAAIRGEELHIAAVGDARAYLIREGAIQQITHDHTLVQQLLDEGALAPDMAADHPRRDVVLRMLGAEEAVRVDVFDLRMRPDDALVLCSDGLTRVMHPDEIATLAGSGSPRSAAETLVRKASDRGSKDNISVVAALVRDGAPAIPAVTEHTWDGRPPSFDQQPTLMMRRTDLSAPSPDETTPGADVRAHLGASAPVGTALPPEPPAETGATVPTQAIRREEVQPAPPYQPGVQPAPPYGGSPQPPAYQPPAPPPPYVPEPPPPQYGQRGIPRGYQPPPGYAIDPVTGLPPVPVQPGEYPAGYPQTGSYAPRIYQPPPGYRPVRRGIPLGRFILVGIAAVLLTVVMVVVLVNPLNWQLPSVAGLVAPPATQAPTATPTEPVAAPTTPPVEEVVAPSPTAPPAAPPGMVLIDGGPFMRGVTDEEAQAAILSCIDESQEDGDPACLPDYFSDAQPVEEVTLSPFFIDATEVTNIDYAACVASEVCTPPSNQEFYADPAFAQHPVVYVTYAQAVQYCTWAGKRLPTEAEWEKAARWDPASGTSLVYPWGNGYESGRANTASAGQGGTSAVQAFAQDRSPYGVLDMAGNVSEWVADWYFGNYEGLGTLNPTGPGSQPLSQPYRVVRGGSFRALAAYARAGQRFDVPPNNSTDWIGFRCAMSVAGAPTPGPAATATTPSETPTGALPATITPTAPTGTPGTPVP